MPLSRRYYKFHSAVVKLVFGRRYEQGRRPPPARGIMVHFLSGASSTFWGGGGAHVAQPLLQNPPQETQGRQNPTKETPGRQNPDQETPGRQNPAEEAPERQNPTQEAPGRQNPTKNAPGRQNPAQETLWRKCQLVI